MFENSYAAVTPLLEFDWRVFIRTLAECYFAHFHSHSYFKNINQRRAQIFNTRGCSSQNYLLLQKIRNDLNPTKRIHSLLKEIITIIRNHVFENNFLTQEMA